MKKIIISLLFLLGCVTPTLTATDFPGLSVKVIQETPKWTYYGVGAPIDSRTIATAAHVVNEGLEAKILGHRIRKIDTIYHRDMIEPIVLLRIQDTFRFGPDEIFKRAVGDLKPDRVITLRGIFPWDIYEVVGGDSGSPILNKSGELIGLIYGWQDIGGGHRRPLYLRF